MKVLVLAPFSHDGIAQISSFGSVTHEDWRDTDVIWDPVELGERATREGFEAIIVERDFLFDETFAAAPNLKVAGITRAGVNQIDVDAATAAGVIVINTPGRNANGVAELAIGLMFDVARRIAESDRYIRAGSWQSPTAPYMDLRGMELKGRTVGIIGFGAIGRRVAQITNALGMTVIAHDPFVAEPRSEHDYVDMVPLDELLESSDIVTLHSPPAEDGTPLLAAEELSSMKTGAFLINTASAELVDSSALAAELHSRHIAGAGYDIFETTPIEPNHPLSSLDNVVLTPHIGGATDESIERHSQMIATDLRKIAAGELPNNLVNPGVWEHRRA
jgi:D-3-phosphoglycerate dehydrogenase